MRYTSFAKRGQNRRCIIGRNLRFAVADAGHGHWFWELFRFVVALYCPNSLLLFAASSAVFFILFALSALFVVALALEFDLSPQLCIVLIGGNPGPV